MGFWKAKTVFITGASSGIGEGLARALARRGAHLGLAARRTERLAVLKEELTSGGGSAEIYTCDVADAAAVERSVEMFVQEFGGVDMLIANAGIGGNNRATREARAEAVAKVININLIGAANAVSAALPRMLEKGSGHLVAVSSLAGFRGLPKSAAYSASKAGMTAFFESLRLDYRRRGIDVTIIQPGFIRTPLTEGRKNRLPFLMETAACVERIISAIEKRRRFAAFPWQLAFLVRAGRIMPGFFYDYIAGRARYRE